MEIYQYKGVKWTIAEVDNLVELVPFGVNGGFGPIFGKAVFAAMLENGTIRSIENEQTTE